MKTHYVRPNLWNMLLELQKATGTRYTWSYLGTSLGMSRQAAQVLFTPSEVSDDSYIKYGTLASLLDFFHAHGMTGVTISDLFAVTVADD